MEHSGSTDGQDDCFFSSPLHKSSRINHSHRQGNALSLLSFHRISNFALNIKMITQVLLVKVVTIT